MSNEANESSRFYFCISNNLHTINSHLNRDKRYLSLFIMGTILIVIGVIIGGIILFAVISGITSAPDIDKQQQWRAKLNASAQALQNRNSATLENILRKIECIDVNIPIKVERSLLNGEWLNMPDAEESFYVSLSTQQIYYKERVIAFNKIINCDYSDNAITTSTQKGTASSTIKTNTGSSIGRALVGGVIAGPAGAIIGGATAKKNAETKIQNKTVSRTTHNYTVRIHIADIVNPLLEIQCGENEEATHKIVSTIFAIIEQNKQSLH